MSSVIESGTITLPNMAYPTVTKNYGTSYTGTNPPQVFVTPQFTAYARMISMGTWAIVHNGSSGTWTGFTLYGQANPNGSGVVFDYVEIG